MPLQQTMRRKSSKREKEKSHQAPSFFGHHMIITVRICGIEATELADLRARFRIFADAKL